MPLFLIGSIVSLAVLANGVSNFAEITFPDFAARINPFNVEAAINAAAPGVVSVDAAERDAARAGLEDALAFSPADARLYSMIGIADETAGDRAAARRRYETALRLQPSEIQALLRTIIMDMTDGDIASAARKTDLLARRWPEQWGLIEPYLPQLLSTEAGQKAFAEAYRETPLGQSRLIRSLIAKPESVELAIPLLLQWSELGGAVEARLVNATCDALIKAGQGPAAHALFLHLLTDAQRAESGYVHNGRFNLDFDGSPFNWRLPKQSGADASRIAGVDRNQVELRFRGNPLQLSNVQQWLRLPPGRYTLSADYATEVLKTPKPLKAVIQCMPNGAVAATLTFAQGTEPAAREETGFAIPPLDCDIALFRVITDYVALSFQNRFDGVFRLFEVRIRRTGG